MSPVSLIVPISVEALCVNARMAVPETQFVGASADFTNLPAWSDDAQRLTGDPYLSQTIRRFRGQTPEPGVHLHWALPDALTHGLHDGQDRVSFPAVPNRWLVARLHTRNKESEAPETQIKAWIVEGDFVDIKTDAFRSSFPYRDPTGRQYFRYVGRVLDLEGWRETEAGGSSFHTVFGQKLTAVGYGDITFAAYYPNCRSLFGFHDDLSTLADYSPATDQLTYLVAGWFSDTADDPLAGGGNGGKPISGAANDLKWAFTGEQVFARTLCSGMVQAVGWDPNADYSARSDKPIEIAIGNTTAEALSALVAAQPDTAGDTDCEFLLNAMQLGLLARLEGQSDRLAKLDAALHGEAFGSSPGGTIWTLRPPPSAGTAATGDAPPADLATLPPALADQLNDLNILQQELDLERFSLASQRQQIFLDWYRYVLVSQRLDEPAPAMDGRGRGSPLGLDLLDTIAPGLDQDTIQQYLRDCLVPLKAREAHCDVLSAQRDAGIARLDASLKSSPQPLLRQPVPAPRFYQPAEPVLLLRGEDVMPPLRHGGDDTYAADGMLPCRLATELVDLLTSQIAVFGSTPFVGLGPSSLVGLDLSATPCPVELSSLLAEAVILDPGQAGYVAAKLRANGESAPAAALRAAVRTLHQPSVAGHPGTVPLSANGRLPCANAVTQWSGTPWVPCHLEWTVDYYPLASVDPDLGSPSFAADAITGSFGLDSEGLDLACTSPPPMRAQRVRGTIPLSSRATANLDREIGQILAQAPNAELEDIRRTLRKTPILSQALSGFNEALLMRCLSIQLDVLDPLSPGDADFTAQIRDAAAGWTESSPLPLGTFAPIRGGFMRLVEVNLIDAFGQLRSVSLANRPVARAKSLMPTGAAAADGVTIYLPPRITQPSRLQFRWLSAGNDEVEMNSHPASSPVCGFVLSDYLDDSLAIYDRNGSALGMLRLVSGGSAVHWQPAPDPGARLAFDPDRATAVEHVRAKVEDAHLRDFVLAILDDASGAALLDNLIRTIDRMLATVVPGGDQPDPSLGTLIGRPLVLARASIDLEICGQPATNQSWQSLLRDTGRPADAPRDTRGFETVDFEVRLGDVARAGDGLIGYFRQAKADPSDFRTFYAELATGKGGVMNPATSPIRVRADPQAAPEIVTLLLDPHAPIHATTGILPVKSIAIPPDQFEAALRNLQIAFPIAPVLTQAAGLALPLPRIPGFAWSWVQARGDAWAVASAGQPGTPEPAVAGLVQPTTSPVWTGKPQRIDEGWLVLKPNGNGGDA